MANHTTPAGNGHTISVEGQEMPIVNLIHSDDVGLQIPMNTQKSTYVSAVKPVYSRVPPKS